MPDFGIFRGFNDKLFGDKLYAGQLPTQLGIIGSQEVSDIDPDAQAFFDRVAFAAGVLSATEQTAVNTLVVKMKFDGIWSKMKAIYPMVGASAAACAQNLKSSSFTGTFTATGWTFASTGAKPNGVNAFMNTNFNQLSNFTTQNLHLSYYTNTGTFNANTVMAGFTTGPSNTFINVFGNLQRGMNQSDNVFAGVTTTNHGFYCGSRTTTTLRKSYFNGLAVFTTTNTATPLANELYYIGAINNGGPAAFFGDFECAFSSIGDGLDDAESLNFYNAVQAFQTTLSRQV